jgi:hypothetical protein
MAVSKKLLLCSQTCVPPKLEKLSMSLIYVIHLECCSWGKAHLIRGGATSVKMWVTLSGYVKSFTAVYFLLS